jgi:hypothetical protein
MHIPYCDSLPNVDLGFWRHLSNICETAKTTFGEDSPYYPPTPAESDLLKAGSRTIQYTIIRNYVLQRLKGDDSIYGTQIGYIESRISMDTPYLEALPKLISLFNEYYRCAYDLYRMAYLKSKRKRQG